MLESFHISWRTTIPSITICALHLLYPFSSLWDSATNAITNLRQKRPWCSGMTWPTMDDGVHSWDLQLVMSQVITIVSVHIHTFQNCQLQFLTGKIIKQVISTCCQEWQSEFHYQNPLKNIAHIPKAQGPSRKTEQEDYKSQRTRELPKGLCLLDMTEKVHPWNLWVLNDNNTE